MKTPKDQILLEIEAQIYPQAEEEDISQMQISEIVRQVNNHYDDSGDKRSLPMSDLLNRENHTNTLPE